MSSNSKSGMNTVGKRARWVAWSGAASIALASGGAASANDNTALLVRSDLIADGVINWKDLNAFLNAFNQGGAQADVNLDGSVNQTDMDMFLSNMGKSYGGSDANGGNAPPLSVGASGGNGNGNASGAKRNPQAPPAPPASAPNTPIPTGDFSVALGNNSLDFSQGSYEILRHRGSIWNKATRGADANVTVVEQDNGFDLVFQLNNDGRRAQKLGSVVLDGFRLGQALKVRDFRASGVDIALDDPGAADIRSGLSYPSEWYSPVMVVQSEIYTLGVSLQYPILDYKHEARLSVSSNGASGTQKVVIELNDDEGPVGYSRDGEIQSGEQRRYVVSVRVLPASENNWISVLDPYKEFFAEVYGRPAYERDPRPVHAAVMASPGAQDKSNPNGFLFDDLRPDVHGFGPWAQELEARADLGWERFMLWRVSGLPSNARGENAGCGKFEFATSLQDTDALGQPGAMSDAFTVLPRFDERGRNLGMWWGDPLRMSNRSKRDDIDVSSVSDAEAALREAHVASLAGAETIGLDGFNTLPAWEAYTYLNEMRAATPGVTYITEPTCGDLLHTLAGALLIAQPTEDSPSVALNTRFFLADYLVPGHETWGLIRVDRMGGPSDDGIREEIFRLAERGFVPVVVPPVQVDRRIVAEETWRDPEW
jgi:hypothetical protein